jgi:type I restriction enzyme S subunit
MTKSDAIDVSTPSAATHARYDEYEDSGLDWLGEIPVHWDPIRLRFLLELSPSKSEVRDLSEDTEVSFVPMESVREEGGLDLGESKQLEEVVDGYTYFRDGDVLVAKITPCFENGKGALAADLTNEIGFGTTELHVLRPEEELGRRYLFYATMSHPFRKVGESTMYGAGGQKRVSDDFIRNLRWPIPPLDEQRAIATYLDRETERIDTLIEKKERLIDLLEEKRTALISRVVTKGLDADVEMQDSGVEWLGEIPAHWEAVKLKFLTEDIIDAEHKTAPFYSDGGYLVVRTSNIREGELRMEDVKFTDEDGFREWTQRGTPEPGDILLTREAPAGEACIVPEGVDLCLGQRVVLLRVKESVLDSSFCVYALYSGVTDEFISMLSQGSTVDHFNISDIANLPILLPPLEEQHRIAEQLRQETRKIDILADKIEEGIARLKEYRTALISAAVTGQIDVREKARV